MNNNDSIWLVWDIAAVAPSNHSISHLSRGCDCVNLPHYNHFHSYAVMPRPPIAPDDCLHQFASEDRKELVVYQRYTLQYDIPTIAVNLCLSERTVQRVLQLWRETGEVISLSTKAKQKRKKILNVTELEVCHVHFVDPQLICLPAHYRTCKISS